VAVLRALGNLRPGPESWGGVGGGSVSNGTGSHWMGMVFVKGSERKAHSISQPLVDREAYHGQTKAHVSVACHFYAYSAYR
jgi:hypothetical protein